MVEKTYISYRCSLEIKNRYQEKSIAAGERLKPNDADRPPLDEETAVKEATRCLVKNVCDSCDLCRYFCPDLCITRDSDTRQIVIDYDSCKGCGICEFICPKGAITMVRED